MIIAWVGFPVNEVEVLTASTIDVPMPPDRTNYVEKSINPQQAFMMVLNDLMEMNKLALFALLLAVAIDMIIIIMAFAGSLIVGDVEHIFDKIKKETNRKLDEISLDDSVALDETLKSNIEKYRKASEYGLDVSRLIWEYKNAKKATQIAETIGSKILINDYETGQIIKEGASIGDDILGKGYKVKMKFKCSGDE